MARERNESETALNERMPERRPERATNAPPPSTPDVVDEDDRIVFSSWDAPLVPDRQR